MFSYKTFSELFMYLLVWLFTILTCSVNNKFTFTQWFFNLGFSIVIYETVLSFVAARMRFILGMGSKKVG